MLLIILVPLVVGLVDLWYTCKKLFREITDNIDSGSNPPAELKHVWLVEIKECSEDTLSILKNMVVLIINARIQ